MAHFLSFTDLNVTHQLIFTTVKKEEGETEKTNYTVEHRLCVCFFFLRFEVSCTGHDQFTTELNYVDGKSRCRGVLAAPNDECST